MVRGPRTRTWWTAGSECATAASGGVVGPTLFGWLIEGGQRGNIMWGYLTAAALMLVAAATEWRLGFAAEGKPLEEVSAPLSARGGSAGP